MGFIEKIMVCSWALGLLCAVIGAPAGIIFKYQLIAEPCAYGAAFFLMVAAIGLIISIFKETA